MSELVLQEASPLSSQQQAPPDAAESAVVAADPPPALCDACSLKWHSYIRRRASRRARDNVSADESSPAERLLAHTGIGSVLVALEAADGIPCGLDHSNWAAAPDLDDMESMNRLEQLKRALARTEMEPPLEPVVASDVTTAALVWTRMDEATPLQRHLHSSSTPASVTSKQQPAKAPSRGSSSPRASSPRASSPGAGRAEALKAERTGGGARVARGAPFGVGSQSVLVASATDSVAHTVGERLQIMQWELERRDRQLRQREATLKSEQTEVKKLRTHLAVKQATLETAFLELKKREHDIEKGEAQLREKRRAIRHREHVDALVANATERRRVAVDAPIARGQRELPRQTDATAWEDLATAEMRLEEQRQQIASDIEQAWHELKLKEEQLATWSSKLRQAAHDLQAREEFVERLCSQSRVLDGAVIDHSARDLAAGMSAAHVRGNAAHQSVSSDETAAGEEETFTDL